MHYIIGGINSHLSLLLETEQSSADAESSGWMGAAGRFEKYRGLPPACTANVSGRIAQPRCPSRAFLKTQDALKPGHCPSSIAQARARHAAAAHPHTCTRRTHGPTHCLPARPQPELNRAGTRPSPARQAAAGSGAAPARHAGPPRPGLDISFFQSCFPLVLSSSGGMGETPSARLCYCI